MTASLLSSISWDFEVTMQGLTSRYGKLGDKFYKQFLPGGQTFEERYPPKVISKRAYELAQELAAFRG